MAVRCNTPVKTSDRTRRIEYLEPGSLVKTREGLFLEVTAAEKKKAEALIRITTIEGRVIDCTPDQRFLAMKPCPHGETGALDYELEWVAAKDLLGRVVIKDRDVLDATYVHHVDIVTHICAKTGADNVCDIAVRDSHTFVASGLVLHD